MSGRSKLLSQIACGLSLLAACSFASADQDKVLQFKSAPKVQIKGQDHLVVLANLPNRRAIRLVVPNDDPKGPYAPVAADAQLIAGFKPGDLIQASWDTADNVNSLSAISHYTPKPGELTPNGYVFVKSQSMDLASDMTLVLNKLGDITNVIVPAEKEDKGDAHRDPLIDATVLALKEGDPVWAEFSTGSKPTIVAIMPYSEPSVGKLIKFDTADYQGQRVPTVVIDTGGTTFVALIPGKLVKGKWVGSSRISVAAHRCKVGDGIFYRAQRDPDAIWLRDIVAQPQPDQQPVAARQGNPDNGSNRDANGVPKGRTVGGAGLVPGVGGGIGIGGF